MKSTVLPAAHATWLADTIARRRAQFAGWQMMADEPGNEPNNQGQPGTNQPPAGGEPPAFPANTRVEDMKPEEQAAYWRDRSQKHETRNKNLLEITGGKYGDDLKAMLTERQQLIDAGLTDSQRAVEQARQEGRTEARGEYGTRLVAAEFKAALAHVDTDRRDQIIDGLSLEKYLTDNGDVATDKVTAYAATIAPADKGVGDRGPDYGAGRRHGAPATSGAGGSAEADRRFGTTQ